MTKTKAIELLNKLKSEIHKDNFDLENWKIECCNIINKIFIETSKTKIEQIDTVIEYVSSIITPRTPQQKINYLRKKEENLKKTKSKAEGILNIFIEEINNFGIEKAKSNYIGIFNKLKRDWTFWSVILVIMTIVFYAGERLAIYENNVERSKLISTIDSLKLNNKKIIKKNEQLIKGINALNLEIIILKKSNDSLINIKKK